MTHYTAISELVDGDTTISGWIDVVRGGQGEWQQKGACGSIGKPTNCLSGWLVQGPETPAETSVSVLGACHVGRYANIQPHRKKAQFSGAAYLCMVDLKG